MGSSDYNSMKKRARTARVAAEAEASDEVLGWYSAATAALEADITLNDVERATAKRALMFEMGRRSSRALNKAKRDNSVTKTFEREVRAQMAAERAAKQP